MSRIWNRIKALTEGELAGFAKSHQVDLSHLEFTDLDAAKKYVAIELNVDRVDDAKWEDEWGDSDDALSGRELDRKVREWMDEHKGSTYEKALGMVRHLYPDLVERAFPKKAI